MNIIVVKVSETEVEERLTGAIADITPLLRELFQNYLIIEAVQGSRAFRILEQEERKPFYDYLQPHFDEVQEQIKKITNIIT